MKKYFLFTLIVFNLFNINLVASSTFESEDSNNMIQSSATNIVTFEDPQLEESVARELGLSSGTITTSDMLSLTSLRLDVGITSLSGLEHAENLNILMVLEESPELTDLSPLKGLTELRWLFIDGAPNLSDLSPLENLKKLEVLSISDANISDLTPVSRLVNIYSLTLDSNAISDISPISGLTNITHLNLEWNNISDITPLSGYNNLIDLNLNENKVEDISVISEFADTLYKLDITSNYISDMSPVGSLNVLETAYLSSQLITLPSEKVYEPTKFTYTLTDIDGSEIPISLEVVTPGMNLLSVGFQGTATIAGQTWTGDVVKVVNYDKTSLVASDQKSVREETKYTNDELIKLFNAENSAGFKVNVDQSKIDYSKPGTYQLEFSDEFGNTKSSNLIVQDVKPTLSINKNSVSIEKNSNLSDVLSQLNVVATELSKGDLNSKVIIDDSQVKYNKVGEYQLEVSVSDNEENYVNKYVTVVVADNELELDKGDNTGSIEFYQFDSQGNPLSGFEYGIYDENGNLVDTIITDENGHAMSGELPKGNYYIELISAPEGYEVNQEPYEIQVGSEVSSVTNVGILKKSKNKHSSNASNTTINDNMTTIESNITIESSEVQKIANSESNQSFSFYVYNQEKIGISGIEYTVFNEMGFMIGSFVSNDDGLVILEKLNPGNYYLIQTKTKDEYILNEEFVNFEVNEQGEILDLANEIFLEEKSNIEVEEEEFDEEKVEIGKFDETKLEFNQITITLLALLFIGLVTLSLRRGR